MPIHIYNPMLGSYGGIDNECRKDQNSLSATRFESRMRMDAVWLMLGWMYHHNDEKHLGSANLHL